jgi:GTP-binding protein HflX
VADLREAVAALLPRPDVDVHVLLPFDRGDLVSRVHTDGDVLTEEHTPQGTLLQARVRPELAAALADYRTQPVG